MSAWNPRYLAYCRAHGRTPEAQMAHDRAAFPGGVMAGFIAWASRQLTAFRAECPEAFGGVSLRDHAAYDRWLDARSAVEVAA